MTPTRVSAARLALVYTGLVLIPAAAAIALLNAGANEGTAGIGTALAPNTLPRILLAVVLILLVSKLGGLLARRLGQPAVVGEIAAGILLGPSALGAIAPQAAAWLIPANVLPHLNTLAQLGVVLFVFLAALEIDPKLLRGQESLAVVVSHVGIALPFLLGVIVAWFGYETLAPAGIGFLAFTLFMGVAMSITALPVMARILQDTGLIRSRVGTVGLSCALVDDVTAWCLLAIVIALVVTGTVAGAIVTAIAAAAFTLVLIFVVRPLLVRMSPWAERNPQAGVLVALVGLLGSALFTEWVGVHSIFGAFLFGLIFPTHSWGWRRKIEESIGGLTMALLLPVFFVMSGLRTDLSNLGKSVAWIWLAVILAVAIFGKFVGATVAARAVGTDWRTSIQLGALMNCRGLTELIVLNVGLSLGVLSPGLFAIMVVMALVSTAMTAPVLKAMKPA